MKYLVRFQEDTALSARMPVPAIFEMVEASRSYLEDLRKKEKIVDFGFYGTGHGLYAVFNVKNGSELYELSSLVPMRTLCRIDSTPIIEGGELADTLGRIQRESVAQWERIGDRSSHAPSLTAVSTESKRARY